ncbi:MAG: 4-phosphoerythronate dehydrogenase [Prevotellaceae bacterium]|jgi:erythronate-4-phosphate dehydrogenase|nr:4-phosphoerythronate dehydrogenase [Prevotellaceae bacterium]
MDIIADKHIPFIGEFLHKYGNISYIEGKNITAATLGFAEALLVRTRTICDAKLLENSCIKYIGTPTIGTDHIDLDYCRRHGITVANAPGSNAPAVMQYVITALLTLAMKKKANLAALTLGIIGVGNVGKQVADAAKALNINVLLNDPPREAREGSRSFTPLDALLRQSDIVTLHLPLQVDTYGYAGTAFFQACKEGAWLLNTSRGEIIDEEALMQYRSKLGALAMDVWRNEPQISTKLLDMTDIATPHIAGYSLQGKRKASQIILQAFAQWCNDPDLVPEIPHPALTPTPLVIPEGNSMQEKLCAVVQQTFPIWETDAQLRRQPAYFEEMRNSYPLRNDFTAYTVPQGDSAAATLQQLGLKELRTKS